MIPTQKPYSLPVAISNCLVVRDIMLSANDDGQSFSKSMEVLQKYAQGVSDVHGPRILWMLSTVRCMLDNDGNPFEAETAAQPPDRSGTGADARIASQDAHHQLQDTASLSNGHNNNAAMGSTGFGGGSSDDSSSDSSSCRDSARRSVSLCWHHRRKQHHSKGGLDPPWDRFRDRDKFSHCKSKREIKSGCHRKGFVKGMTWTHYLFVPSRMLIDPDTRAPSMVGHTPYSWLYAMPFCERRSPVCRFGTLPVELQ
jgi:hypothetical protein